MTAEVATIWVDFHKELKAFILNKTRNSADTDDILQEVFVKIIRNYDKVNQSENLRHYLYGIVRNAVNDYFRHKRSNLGTTEIKDGLSEEENQNLNVKVAESCIKPLINKLPEHYREALMITELQDVSQKELADRLGISYSGAKSRVQRGKEKLKEFFAECCAYQSDSYGNLILMQSKTSDCNCNEP